MTLHLMCAFEVVTLPNKRAITLFHYFFLQIARIVEIHQKANNTTTSRTLVSCSSQKLATFT